MDKDQKKPVKLQFTQSGCRRQSAKLSDPELSRLCQGRVLPLLIPRLFPLLLVNVEEEAVLKVPCLPISCRREAF